MKTINTRRLAELMNVVHSDVTRSAIRKYPNLVVEMQVPDRGYGNYFKTYNLNKIQAIDIVASKRNISMEDKSVVIQSLQDMMK